MDNDHQLAAARSIMSRAEGRACDDNTGTAQLNIASIRKVRRVLERDREIHRMSADEMLSELVSRDVIHPSRLLRNHEIWIHDDHYRMKHPLSCDLEHCPYDQVATNWNTPPVPNGHYEWSEPMTDALEPWEES